MLGEIVQELLREIIQAMIEFDSPKRMKLSERQALERRTAPYRVASILAYIALALLLIGLTLWVTIASHLPLPGLQLYVVGICCYTLGLPLLSLLLMGLLPGKWSFTNFHTACGMKLQLGPGGFGVGLGLLHIALLVLYLIGG